MAFFFFLQEKFILSYISLKFNNKYSPLTPPKTDEKWEGKRRLLNWVITEGVHSAQNISKTLDLVWGGFLVLGFLLVFLLLLFRGWVEFPLSQDFL